MGSKPLKNKRHELFAKSYLEHGLNATRAYREVYGDSKGIMTSASKLLSNPKVAERVAHLFAERNDRIDENSDEFLEQLKYSAMFDPKEVFEFDGEVARFKSFDEIPIEARRLIDSIKTKNYTPKDGDPYCEIEVKFTPKAKMKELFGRHRGVFNDKLNIKTEITLETLVDQSHDQD